MARERREGETEETQHPRFKELLTLTANPAPELTVKVGASLNFVLQPPRFPTLVPVLGKHTLDLEFAFSAASAVKAGRSE